MVMSEQVKQITTNSKSESCSQIATVNKSKPLLEMVTLLSSELFHITATKNRNEPE